MVGVDAGHNRKFSRRPPQGGIFFRDRYFANCSLMVQSGYLFCAGWFPLLRQSDPIAGILDCDVTGATRGRVVVRSKPNDTYLIVRD